MFAVYFKNENRQDFLAKQMLREFIPEFALKEVFEEVFQTENGARYKLDLQKKHKKWKIHG